MLSLFGQRQWGSQCASNLQVLGLNQSPNFPPHRTGLRHESPNVSSLGRSATVAWKSLPNLPLPHEMETKIPRPPSSTCTRCREWEAVEIQKLHYFKLTVSFLLAGVFNDIQLDDANTLSRSSTSHARSRSSA